MFQQQSYGSDLLHALDDAERMLNGKLGVTFSVAAKVLSISEQHVRRLIREGQLFATGRGRANRKVTVESIRIRRGY